MYKRQVLNIALDPLFIFGLNMGVQGGALATVLSQLGSCIFVLAFLFSKRVPVRIRFGGYRFSIMRQVLKVGFTPFIIIAIDNVMIIAMNAVLQHYGGAEQGDMLVTTATIVQSFMLVVTMPLGGISGGTQTILGFNYGACNTQRVRQAVRRIAWMCVGYTGVLFVLARLAGPLFVRLFTQDPSLSLIHIFRTTVNGHVTGGPIYYIRAAFKGRFGAFLAGFFSVAIILALGFMGNMVQSNSIGAAFSNAFHIPALVVGFFVAAVSAFIFIGGVKRIASVTEKLVPVMAVFYIVGCLIILFINRSTLLNCFQQIFVLAFQPQAMAGGVAGVTVKTAMRFGVARGLFSNEAGMGSTPHAHALAKVERPQDQGVIAMMGVFIDTFVILTLTALVILSSGALASGCLLYTS